MDRLHGGGHPPPRLTERGSHSSASTNAAPTPEDPGCHWRSWAMMAKRHANGRDEWAHVTVALLASETQWEDTS